MEDLDAIQSAYIVLSDIEALIVDVHGEDHYTNFKNNNVLTMLQTEHFILTFSHSILKYHISFPLGMDCRMVSEVTIMILGFIKSSDLIVMEDHFWDYDKNSLVYGEDAIAAKHKMLLDREGVKECIICDTLAPIECIDSSGFCDICAKTKDQISWH